MESFEVVTVSHGIDGKLILELLSSTQVTSINRFETQLGVNACATVALAFSR